MKTSILNSWRKYLIVFFLLAVIFACAFMYIKHESSLVGGYKYISGRVDDLHIQKGGEVIISPTMVDFDIVSNYIVGLRLPVQHLECDGGDGYKIKIMNKKEYFILDTDSEIVFDFFSEREFFTKLKEIGILEDVSLEYSRFAAIWEQFSSYYKNVDYSTCVPIKK